MKKINFVYFGGEPIGVPVLQELEKENILPGLIVCNPDRPVGRKQVLTPPPVKEWALEHGIEVWQPSTFKEREIIEEKLKQFELFVVVAYNKILPKWLIEMPTHNTLNVHPSLLPLLRGASPIRSAILADMREEIGVSVMVLDEKMDTGPVVVQKKLTLPLESWPISGTVLDAELAQLGGKLLAATIPGYVEGNLIPQPQEDEYATYCSRLERSMGELTIDPNNLPSGNEAHQALLKIRAFEGFPGTFFMHGNKRVKIIKAQMVEDHLYLERVTPEGKKEMDVTQFLKQ